MAFRRLITQVLVLSKIYLQVLGQKDPLPWPHEHSDIAEKLKKGALRAVTELWNVVVFCVITVFFCTHEAAARHFPFRAWYDV